VDDDAGVEDLVGGLAGHFAAKQASQRGQVEHVSLLRAENQSDGEELTGGEFFERIKPSLPLGYTRYYEILTKLEAMRLIDVHYRSGRGRSRVITLRYEADQILLRLG
ncbi:MAG TPA: hypothetical protein PLY91_09860, partial [Methanoregulaceae archaeon]|nr:hypothetical protein [Methanoregulaceae archaeon]